MTPPVHDREQAIQTVLGVRLDSPLGECHLNRAGAERIVDALLGQPDARAERAEERLRAVGEAARSVMSGILDDLDENEHGRQLIDRLRAVLSEQEGDDDRSTAG